VVKKDAVKKSVVVRFAIRQEFISETLSKRQIGVVGEGLHND
jgi:hypothetical protein